MGTEKSLYSIYDDLKKSSSKHESPGKSIKGVTIEIVKLNYIRRPGLGTISDSFVNISNLQNEEWLTRWMHVQPFLSVVLIGSNNGEAHILDACTAVLISGSYLLKQWRVTHRLNGCTAVLISVLIRSNDGEQLTAWMHVHPFSSVFWSNRTMESDSHAGCIYSSSCQRFWTTQTMERLTFWMHVQPFSSVVLICSNSVERLTRWMHVQPFLSVVLIGSNIGVRLTNCYSGTADLVSSSELIQQWRATHRLDAWTVIFVSGSDPLKQWRTTNQLDACTAVLISGSDPLKQ